MSMTDLAKEIQNYSDYSPDKTVRLIVCRGGEGPNSAAEQLAKALGSNPEPPRESRRPVGVSHAAMASSRCC
ncbi:MAG: hypothetical protein KatS3mg082_3248 [Nitrospiraceae bacterium]|nr:MAG: hypothetical protein KatS3mg082_3248 [Nitrospiraceae bacterium]